jgi:hypothetical protein
MEKKKSVLSKASWMRSNITMDTGSFAAGHLYIRLLGGPYANWGHC